MYAATGEAIYSLLLPPPSAPVLPGIVWGRFDALFTPAYWCGQAWQHERLGTYSDARLGLDLREELAACLLGGFGMKAELALAAFRRLRDDGYLANKPSAYILEKALTEPFLVEGKFYRYRFPRQKAIYLAECLKQLEYLSEPTCDLRLRDELAALPGIGLKTASWIVRNHRASNEVAIIDVHILRAGRLIGIFGSRKEPSQHYRELEAAFLDFSVAIDVPAGLLDGLMWDYMRRFGTSFIVHNRIGHA